MFLNLPSMSDKVSTGQRYEDLAVIAEYTKLLAERRGAEPGIARGGALLPARPGRSTLPGLCPD